MGVELIRSNAYDLRSSLFCTATEFFMDVKSAYRDQTKNTEADIIKHFGRPSLLVIDELGKRGDTEWENRMLYELINRRYMDMKDTLLVSNLAVEIIGEALGDSLNSRMRETGGILDCNWASFRV